VKRKAFTALDALVLGALLAGNWVLVSRATSVGPATAVEVISVQGSSTVPLGADRHLDVTGPLGVTVVELGPDGAEVRSSPCPLQICVRSGPISRPGRVVACLPNRVAIRLLAAESTRAEGVDAVGR
jgi:hypothetical protein